MEEIQKDTDFTEENTEVEKTKGEISVSLSVVPVINYVLYRNGVKAVQGITITNNSQTDLSDVKLTIETNPAFATAESFDISFIPAGKSYEIKSVDLHLDIDYLASMTERVDGEVKAVLHSDVELATTYEKIGVLAFDQWSGSANHPELLAAFVTPNHPALATIISRAATFLNNWTGDPSFTGYLSKDPDRVMKQAAAIFSAIKEENIIYSVLPPSFEVAGQRVRLCDMVLQQKNGNCMDLTLLYVSCLEAVGLHPLMIMLPDHIFTGVWLDELTFPDAVSDDVSMITKRIAEGVNEIAVIETTLARNASNATFDDAVRSAESQLVGKAPIECIIDVKRARLCGITPIPQRVHDSEGWHIEHDLPKEQGDKHAPDTVGQTIEIDSSAFDPEAVPKIVQWERKLLDLGLRNNLINLRFSKNLVPILANSLDEFEDSLSQGEDFSILPRPTDWEIKEDFDFENMHNVNQYAQLMASEFKNKRLRSVLPEAQLAKTMKTLYRNAKTALEENGANTLYLVLGILRWYENPRSNKARYAPVIMLPVEIVRRTGNKGYTLRLRDDEPQINVTILEKFKQDFGINISGLDPLPIDDNGVDLRRVFTTLRKAMMGQDRWDVLESAYLGIFSFSQFVMWSDLRHRSDELIKNKIVRSLIDGKLAWDAKPMVIGQSVAEGDTLLPMPADASQLFAIQAACEGESFVLHGPPGTGKSQTITSLIANALAKGKSVLFVAEKKAALDVVQKRLESIGVAPFCLELHSNKTKKRAVLDQLRIATEVAREHTPEQYAQKAERLKELRENLDCYATQLHTVLPCGYSVYALINEYEEYVEAPDLIVLGAEFANATDSKTFESNIILLERLVAAAKALGHPHKHPLSPVGINKYTQQLRYDLPEIVTAYRDAASDFVPSAKSLAEILSFKNIINATQLAKLAALAESVSAFKNYPIAWAKVEKPIEYFAKVKEMAEHYLEYNKRKSYLLKYWNEDFLKLDGAALYAESNEIASSWLVPKLLGQRKLAQRLSEYANNNNVDIAESIKVLCRMQQEYDKAAALLQNYGDDLGVLYKGEETDWNQIIEYSAIAQQHIAILQEFVGGYTERVTICSDQNAVTTAADVIQKYPQFKQRQQAFYDLLQITCTEDENWLELQQEMCENILANKDSLKEWITFVGISAEVKDAQLGDLVDAYCAGANHEDIVPAYKKATFKALIMNAIDNEGVLNAFSGPVFNEKIEQYKRLDKEYTSLVRQELFCRLAANIPDFTGAAAQSSELGILQRAIKNGGRGISIRKLFEQLPNLLPRLCPCMLMSPISAAQYLDPKREPFDIVVFDEASQLPTCKAVGVLARGHNAVIVGDPKQMPPTTFFSINSVDEENLQEEDLESILDDCLAINMPQTHLLWHYRSRHESLISFSNHQFYENKLFTFPSVNDRESKVSLVHVEGVFERGKGRRNRAEAEAVVKEICRRCHDPELSKLSVGVITFNISQQTLIDDMLNEACEKDPELEKWMYESEEPLFVKNLENVQGDEREVILFSIGYGPDENGRVYMNFGPLNRDGGWRRLNVAVSRARSEMIVFSTLKPEQIDLSKTSAEGVAALKAFLMYAAGEEIALNEHSSKQLQDIKDGIAKRIRQLLKQEGFDTELNVGHSKYKIDIGVIDPRNPENYILGILLDGSSYESAKTTRDRELAQIEVLCSLGWNVMRVWTMDWWDNRGKEIARIVAEVQRLLSCETPVEPPAEEADVQSNEGEQQELAETTETFDTAQKTPQQKTAPECIRPYITTILSNQQITADDIKSGGYDYLVLRAIETILDAEAPIYKTVLIKRVLNSFGISRSGEGLNNYLINLAKNLHPIITTDGEEQVYWTKNQDPSAYYIIRVSEKGDLRREPSVVPWIEAVNAMCYALYTQIGMPRDELAREAIKLLGYQHLVGEAAALVVDAFAKLQEMELVRIDNRENCSLTEKGNEYASHFKM